VSRLAQARHVCWSYDDRAGLEAFAEEFLGAGLAAGEQVWFAAFQRRDALMQRLEQAISFGDGDAVRFVPLAEAYPAGHVIDPAAQVANYRYATEQALADGYTGLRVVAEATSLVLDAAQLEAFTRYENLIDRYMAGAPMRAVCAYDRTVLTDAAIVALACMHPDTNATGVPFRLHADPQRPAGTVLAGELDMTTDESFPSALRRAELRPVDGELVMQADGLQFVDHRSLLHLQRLAEEHATTVVLRTGRSAAAHLTELLGLDRVRVEVTR
jgi:hypothetical protein